jgi:hypothetical protein
MWFKNDEAHEFWDRDEARDVLQEFAMESIVTRTRWRTITDPAGAKCFYNLKTGDITYDPPKSVPWRFAAETYAQAFPPVENDDEDTKKKGTKSDSPVTKQKTKGMKKAKTLQKQKTAGRSSGPPGVVADSSDEDDDDDGLPPTKTLRVSRDPKGTARYVARAGNDVTTQRYLGRAERKDRMKKTNFAAALDFRNLK